MWRRTAGRWRRAMSALAVVEHRSTALPSVLRWRQFTVSGSAAYQPAALTASPAPTGTGLPAKIAPAEPPAATPLTAPVAADAVVIGKFDRGRQARMRAFYSAEGLCARRSEERRVGKERRAGGRSGRHGGGKGAEAGRARGG